MICGQSVAVGTPTMSLSGSAPRGAHPGALAGKLAEHGVRVLLGETAAATVPGGTDLVVTRPDGTELRDTRPVRNIRPGGHP